MPLKLNLKSLLVSLCSFDPTAELERFLVTVEKKHGVTRRDIATQGVYFSHETCTHATPTASCAYNEIYGLRQCFGALLETMIIINTKVQYGGHIFYHIIASGARPNVATSTIALTHASSISCFRSAEQNGQHAAICGTLRLGLSSRVVYECILVSRCVHKLALAAFSGSCCTSRHHNTARNRTKTCVVVYYTMVCNGGINICVIVCY